jgi:hypothetical protein
MTSTGYITLGEAMAWLNKDHEWRRFQVGYPPARSGDMGIEVYKIPRDDPDRARIVHSEGMERDPGFGTFRKLVQYEIGPPDIRHSYPRKTLWMSDTRAEIHEHYPFLNKVDLAAQFGQARRILINGLGLGVVVHGVLLYPGVERVDIVEVNHDVIKLISPLIHDDRVHIHEASAYDIEWPRGMSWDLAWHDIWPDISDLNLPEMDRLVRKYKHCTKWQGCWQREGCLAMRKFYRDMERGSLDPMRALEVLGGKAPWLS